MDAVTTGPERLRELIDGDRMVHLMEAHDGLSARIAEVEGFEALWASGFSISTALGVRDSDEATWSQLLGVVENMADAATIPIVVDGDTGYGNFNTARRFARHAERIGVAGICFEDKLFPKINSFVGSGAAHDLEDVDRFCGKLNACQEGRADGSVCIIARTEALIAGLGIDEALRRATAYREAGADALFIHSRLSVADEIEEFALRWENRLPVVIAPTTYATNTPTEVFESWGISAVIWANQSMRAAVAAMRKICRDIRAGEPSVKTDPQLAPLSEVFELLQYDELEEATGRYEDWGKNGASATTGK
jgi:phosphoenolpyruvate phosphomutase